MVRRMKPRISSLMPRMRPVPSPLRRSSTTAGGGKGGAERETDFSESADFGDPRRPIAHTARSGMTAVPRS